MVLGLTTAQFEAFHVANWKIWESARTSEYPDKDMQYEWALTASNHGGSLFIVWSTWMWMEILGTRGTQSEK